ncbi:MAG: magnesium transporter [Solirubrobacterales bacterium]
MLYLSTYLGRPVFDAANRPVGRVLDLVARLDGEYPLVIGLRVRTKKRTRVDLDWTDVRAFEISQVILTRTTEDLHPFTLGDRDVLLARNVMDKQIVDLEDRRLIRVQDVQLARTGTRLRVIGVDVSTSALLRRLRFAKLADRVARRKPPDSVAWSDVDVGSWKDPNVKLRVTRSGVRRLHPADLAEIASELPPAEGVGLLEALEEELAADTLEEMTPEDQVRMLEALGPERAARLLERMSPDDAADLLQDLEREDAEALLSEMDRDEAAEILKLLRYEEESAGGLMTTEFVTVKPEVTCQGVIEALRNRVPDEEHAYHVYVTDETGTLVGEISLYELVVAPGEALVGSVMHEDPISVGVDERQDEVVEAITKYNLLAVPVVDEEDHLVGIVTVDDVIDLVRPQEHTGARRFLG